NSWEDQMAEAGATVQGKRIAIVGRLASMNRRELAHLLRQHGAVVLEKAGPEAELIVLGEWASPSGEASGDATGLGLPPELQEAADQGRVELVRESQLWQRLGLVDPQQEVHRLYTLAMLAELLRTPLAEVRRWYRRGWLRPARLVHKLPYFDFQEVTVARRLAELHSAGASQQTIQRQMAELSRAMPEVPRPLSQLPVRIEGKRILVWRDDRLMEPTGQFRFDFESPAAQTEQAGSPAGPLSEVQPPSGALLLGGKIRWGVDAPPYYSPEELVQIAQELEEAGQLRESAEMLRAALAAGGPSAELCFQLAEVLYQLGDVSAARERYYMAVELDEDFVEARCNLGCLLAETGEAELALAALQGALAYHPHYADAHYQLARLLDELGRSEEAQQHWRSFLALAPESPWVEQARNRLGEPHG
ncbi:MAG TPA: tetratricopeptide repeat protein, partial [Thermoguttaceae bacterium]|nr:tetratricopeptide repeat protein [Thermoguttaceae bacterium]